MPAVTLNLYDKFRQSYPENDAVIDIEVPGGNGIKCAHVTSAYTVDQDLHNFFDDITNEVTGTNYTAGGNVMSNGDVSNPHVTTGLITVDIDDPATWLQHASGFSDADQSIVYADSAVAATSRLIGYTASYGPKGNVDGPFSVIVNAAGLFTMPR